MQKGSLRSKVGGTTPEYVMPRPPHRPLDWSPSWKTLHTCIQKGPRVGQVWKKTPDNWPQVNKGLAELSYMNYLATSLPCFSLGRMPTPLLSGCASLPGFGSTRSFSVFSHLLLSCVSNNKLCTCLFVCLFFYSFCLLGKCSFH